MSRTGTSSLLAAAAMRKGSPASPPQSVKAESVSARLPPLSGVLAAQSKGQGQRSTPENIGPSPRPGPAMPMVPSALANVRDLEAAASDGRNEVALRAQRQLLQTYNDLAVDCLLRGFFQEAVQLLNKAIRVEKHELALYLNRGGTHLLWLYCKSTRVVS